MSVILVGGDDRVVATGTVEGAALREILGRPVRHVMTTCSDAPPFRSPWVRFIAARDLAVPQSHDWRIGCFIGTTAGTPLFHRLSSPQWSILGGEDEDLLTGEQVHSALSRPGSWSLWECNEPGRSRSPAMLLCRYSVEAVPPPARLDEIMDDWRTSERERTDA